MSQETTSETTRNRKCIYLTNTIWIEFYFQMLWYDQVTNWLVKYCIRSQSTVSSRLRWRYTYVSLMHGLKLITRWNYLLLRQLEIARQENTAANSRSLRLHISANTCVADWRYTCKHNRFVFALLVSQYCRKTCTQYFSDGEYRHFFTLNLVKRNICYQILSFRPSIRSSHSRVMPERIWLKISRYVSQQNDVSSFLTPNFTIWNLVVRPKTSELKKSNTKIKKMVTLVDSVKYTVFWVNLLRWRTCF